MVQARQYMRYRSRVRFLLEGLEGIVVLGCVLLTWPLSKRWLANWGSRADERERKWPGDTFVPPNHIAYTRGVDVAAAAENVWPWIAQFGLNRAGFYSYEFFERLMGIPVINVESIEPTLQSVSVGGEVKLHPKAPGIPVAELQPGKHICFGVDRDSAASSADAELARSWSMYLRPGANETCRLLLRGCLELPRRQAWLKRLALAFEEPIDFVMEQRMLRTVRRLAESGRR